MPDILKSNTPEILVKIPTKFVSFQGFSVSNKVNLSAPKRPLIFMSFLYGSGKAERTTFSQ